MKKQINQKLKKLKVQYKNLFKEMERIEYEASAAFGYDKKEADAVGLNDWMMDYLQEGITLEDLHDRVPIKSALNDKWEIKSFDDYHDIMDYKEDEYLGRHELGCFPSDFGYSRYFGVFWNAELPTKKEILNCLQKKVKSEIIIIGKKVVFDDCKVSFPKGCK